MPLLLEVNKIITQIELPSPYMPEAKLREDMAKYRTLIKKTKKLMRQAGKYPMMAFYLKPAKLILDKQEKELKRLWQAKNLR